MKKRNLLLPVCILFIAWQGLSQILPPERPSVPAPPHKPGFPATDEQALAENGFSPAAPGYWNYDSSYYHQWLTVPSNWYLWEKYFPTYNIAGYMAQGLYLVYDSVTATWNNSTRWVNNYDASNVVISRQGQAWNTATSEWVDFTYTHYNDQLMTDEYFYRTFDRIHNKFISGSRNLYFYDAAGNYTERVIQDWDTLTGDWVNSSRETYEYSATQKMTLYLTFVWNAATSTWDNNYKYDYTYDANDFSTGYLSYVWETTITDWRNNIHATYSNNPNGDPITRLFEFWIVGPDAWQNYQYDEIQYNANNKTTEFITQYWNSITSGWDNYRSVTYTYHPNQNQESQLEEIWNPNTSGWMDSYYYLSDSTGYNLEYYVKSIDWLTYTYSSGYRYAYEYNENSRPVVTLNQNLDISTNTWLDAGRRLTSYDPAGNMVLELDQTWDGSIWNDQYKMVHYYSEHVGALAQPDPLSSLCYFANPLKKDQAVRCPGLDPSRQYTLYVFGVNGQQVYTAGITSFQPVHIPGNIASGIYLMQIYERGSMVAAGRVVITD
jgi:hypothetical protein